MKHTLFLSLSLCFVCTILQAQTDTLKTYKPFVGHFFCEDTGVHIYLNLYEATLEAPNFSFLGKMNGYMLGNIYGTWMTTNHKVNNKKATIRFVNDIGSDTQTVDFTQVNDSVFIYRTIGSNTIRRAVGHKLVKVTGDMTFVKQQK